MPITDTQIHKRGNMKTVALDIRCLMDLQCVMMLDKLNPS